MMFKVCDFWIFLFLSIVALEANAECSKHVSFITEMYQKNNTILASGYTKEHKIELIEQIIIDSIDEQTIALLVFNKHVVIDNPKEKKTFINQFSYYIARRYAAAIYKDFRKTDIVTSRVVKRSQCVTNTIVMHKGVKRHISYFTLQKGENIKIYDVAFDGRRESIRSSDEFASVLKMGGVAAIMSKIKQYLG